MDTAGEREHLVSAAGDLLAGRYRLQRLVGSGAMGVVWQARDERLHRLVAVKQLRLQPGLDPARAKEARQRAMREGRIAARLHHPHAISVHDIVVDDGLPVLVMEYLPSRSLADVLTDRGPLSAAETARIGGQAAAALAAAHAAGVVHRDIKPGNILITEDGTAKITDFGISHAAGDIALTQAGLLAGTPAFLAPEVAAGHRPTPSADVYSLGATLYAAVEGAPPFGYEHDNPIALLHQVAAGDIPAPRRAGALTPVLARMVCADPAARLTAAQAGDALYAVAAGRPVSELLPPVEAGWSAPVGQPASASADRGPGGTLVATVPSAGGTRIAPTPGEYVGLPRQRRRTLLYLLAGVLVAMLAGALLIPLAARDERPSTPPIPPAELERTVSDYYTLLPGQRERAWNHLGPALRADGKQRYVDFWRTVSALHIISPARATGENTVHVGVELVLPDGTRIREFHQLGLIRGDGGTLIDTDDLLHSERLAPPPRAPEDKGEGKGDDRNEGRGKGDDRNEGRGEGDDDRNGEQDKRGEQDKKGEDD